MRIRIEQEKQENQKVILVGGFSEVTKLYL